METPLTSEPELPASGQDLWAVPPGSRLEIALGNLSTEQVAGQPAAEYLLSMIDERKREVVERRFGLNGYSLTTFEDVGHALDLTRETIRLIQNQALKEITILADEVRKSRGL